MEDTFKQLALYNQWINKSIFEAAARLCHGELCRDRSAYFGSIIGTLNHILVGDICWFKRFADHPANFQSLNYFRSLSNPGSLDEILHDELPDLCKAREQSDRVILQFTTELTEKIIASTLSYRNIKGHQYNKNLGHLLLHVFNHQTHHRGQVSTLLYQAGIDVGVTDLVAGIPEV